MCRTSNCPSPQCHTFVQASHDFHAPRTEVLMAASRGLESGLSEEEISLPLNFLCTIKRPPFFKKKKNALLTHEKRISSP